MTGALQREWPSAIFERYQLDDAFDEMFESKAIVRQQYHALYENLLELGNDEMNRRKQALDLSFLHQGITFTVY